MSSADPGRDICSQIHVCWLLGYLAQRKIESMRFAQQPETTQPFSFPLVLSMILAQPVVLKYRVEQFLFQCILIALQQSVISVANRHLLY